MIGRAIQLHPAFIEIDISKAPRVGEEVDLTYRIVSLYEVMDFSTMIHITKRTVGNAEKRVLIENVVSGADLAWQGDLKPGEPVVVTSTVVFTEAGDWRIGVFGEIPVNEVRPGDVIWLNVTDARGSFGWEERHTRTNYDPSASQIPEPTETPKSCGG